MLFQELFQNRPHPAPRPASPLEIPLFDGKILECFPDGIQMMPWSFPRENSSSTAAQMFSHQGQDMGKAFLALFLQLGILFLGFLDGLGQFTTLWMSGIVTSRMTPSAQPQFQQEFLDFLGYPWCPSELSCDPPAQHQRSRCSGIPAVLASQQDHLPSSGKKFPGFSR